MHAPERSALCARRSCIDRLRKRKSALKEFPINCGRWPNEGDRPFCVWQLICVLRIAQATTGRQLALQTPANCEYCDKDYRPHANGSAKYAVTNARSRVDASRRTGWHKCARKLRGGGFVARAIRTAKEKGRPGWSVEKRPPHRKAVYICPTVSTIWRATRRSFGNSRLEKKR